MNGLPGYDEWKTASPYDDERVCEECGEELTRWPRHGWHCEACNPRDPDWEMDLLRENRREP